MQTLGNGKGWGGQRRIAGSRRRDCPDRRTVDIDTDRLPVEARRLPLRRRNGERVAACLKRHPLADAARALNEGDLGSIGSGRVLGRERGDVTGETRAVQARLGSKRPSRANNGTILDGSDPVCLNHRGLKRTVGHDDRQHIAISDVDVPRTVDRQPGGPIDPAGSERADRAGPVELLEGIGGRVKERDIAPAVANDRAGEGPGGLAERGERRLPGVGISRTGGCCRSLTGAGPLAKRGVRGADH